MNPARAHFLRASAAAMAAVSNADAGLEGATIYETMLSKLASDKRRLKQIQSLTVRADIKREVLPDYLPYVEGVLSAGNGTQDDVLVTVMLWRIDAGDYPGALTIAAYAIEHQLVMTEQYKRTLPTLLAEEFAAAAKRARDGKTAFDLEVLQRVAALVDGQDMPDKVRAKLFKEIGLLLVSSGTDEHKRRALDVLRQATQLDEHTGVKKDIEKLEREIEKLPPADG